MQKCLQNCILVIVLIPYITNITSDRDLRVDFGIADSVIKFLSLRDEFRRSIIDLMSLNLATLSTISLLAKINELFFVDLLLFAPGI